MPIEAIPSGSTTTPTEPVSTPPSQPASTPSIPSTPSAAPASSPVPSTPSAAAPPSPAAAPPAQPSLRERLGSDFTRYADDEAALRAIQQQLSESRNLQPFAQLGQQAMPQWGEFQRWQAEQKQAQQAAEAKKAQWWTSPEWDPQWTNCVDVDPQTGEMRPKPGYAPDLPAKILAYRSFQREKIDSFMKNPVEMMRPGLEQMIQQEAQKLIKQEMGGYQQNQVAKQLIEQDSSWIFEHDQNKNKMHGPDGAPLLSVAGSYYKQKVIDLEANGMSDPKMVHDTAKQLTHGYLMQQVAAGKPVTAPAAAAPAAPAGVNRLQGINPEAAIEQPGTRGKQPLGARMRAALEAAGIGDKDFGNN